MEYDAEALKAELSEVVHVDATIEGNINYDRYIEIIEHNIESGYYDRYYARPFKNKRIIKIEKPVVGVGFYLVAKVDGEFISFNGGERKLRLNPDEIEMLKDTKFTYGVFNSIVLNHSS